MSALWVHPPGLSQEGESVVPLRPAQGPDHYALLAGVSFGRGENALMAVEFPLGTSTAYPRAVPEKDVAARRRWTDSTACLW